MIDLVLPGLFAVVMVAFLVKPIVSPRWNPGLTPMLAILPFAVALAFSASQGADGDWVSSGVARDGWILPFLASPLAIWGVWQLMIRSRT